MPTQEAAKPKRNTVTPPAPPTDPIQPTQTETPPSRHTEIMVAVPIARKVEGYEQRHVQIRLTVAQGNTLRRVLDALNAQSARLADGHHVESGADAVRWILERIADQN